MYYIRLHNTYYFIMKLGGIQAQPIGQEDHLIPLHVLIGINKGEPGYLIELDNDNNVVMSLIH